MRTAMSAGALALMLGGGIPAAVIIPVETTGTTTAARQDDCDHGGLLGTVTGGVCRTVDNLVSSLTEDTAPLAPLLSPLSPPAAGEDAAPEAPPATERTSAPEASASAAQPSEKKAPSKDPGDACRSAAASAGCPDAVTRARPAESTRPTAFPSPSRDRGHDLARRRPVPTPTGRTPPPSRSPHAEGTPASDQEEPVIPEPPPMIDPEAPRVELLWPAPLTQKLQRQMANEPPVTPSRSSDTAGTALTVALLVMAILAVRLLYGRQRVRESIPFEPSPPKHHRVA